jgi:colanic acid biosynthesis glycosyl transferase WcaI
MKVMLLTNCYPPEIGAAANQLYELARELSGRGHRVTVVTRFPRHIPKELMPEKTGKLVYRETSDGIKIMRINIPLLPRSFPLLREIEHILNILMLWGTALFAERTDVTLVYSPPIVVGYAAVFLRIFKGSRVVFNVQDIFPQSMIDLGLLNNRALIAVSRYLEKLIYKKVDHITVHSRGNEELVVETSRSPAKVSIVPNWVDSKFIVPLEDDNGFRREFGLCGKFVVSFAGCISDAQDMDIILESAEMLKERDDILFLLAGNGPNYEAVKEKAGEFENVKVIPIQPRHRYVHLLAASDVSVVTLNKRVDTPVVPSKILSIMSSGTPLLASLPKVSDGVAIIEEAECGICVEAGNSQAFRQAILKLYESPELCAQFGRNGRDYAVKNYSLEACVDLYVDVFNKVINKNAQAIY